MKKDVTDLVERQRAFFNSGVTRPVAFRKAQLKKLRDAVLASEKEILAALAADLGKSDFEAFTTEIVLVLEELKTMLRHVLALGKTGTAPRGDFSTFPERHTRCTTRTESASSCRRGTIPFSSRSCRSSALSPRATPQS